MRAKRPSFHSTSSQLRDMPRSAQWEQTHGKIRPRLEHRIWNSILARMREPQAVWDYVRDQLKEELE